MRRIISLFLMILYTVLSFAQMENVWVFNNAGIDFNTGGGEPVGIATAMDTKEAAASVCDESGALLFYTEGSVVWDKNHQVMPNGTALTPFANTFMTPTVSTTQGAVIVPMIDSPHKYYIFSLVASEWGSDMGNLYYSVVDMTLNGGLGDISPTRKAMFVASGMIEKMTPVVGNDCNIWLLTCSQDERFHAFEITEDGVNSNSVVSNVGVGDGRNVYGAMTVSPNRKKIAAASSSRASIFDFDASTGLVSNEIIVHNRGAYGVCFSPDNSKLYVSGFGIQSAQTIQFDLDPGDPDSIRQSATNLGGLQFVNLKAGPDGRIYFGSSNTRLGVIKFPNLKGTACEFTPNAVVLPGSPGLSSNPALPNLVPILKKEKITTTQTYEMRFVDEVAIQAQELSGLDYLWNDGVSGSGRVIDEAGTYWVSYHIPPCRKQTDTFKITFPCALPKIETSNSCGVASTGSAWAKVRADNPAIYSYLWKNHGGAIMSDTDSMNNVPAGAYSLEIQTNTGCDTVIYFEIIADNYKVSFQADTLVCEGQEMSFKNTSDGYFETFQWSFGDSHTSNQYSPDYIYDKNGVYTVMLTGEGKYCSDTAFQEVRVDAVMDDLYLLTDKKASCMGETVIFQTVVDSTSTGLIWNLGDGPGFRSSDKVIQRAYDKPGKKTIGLTARFRVCPDISLTDSVHIYPLPVVYLGKDTSICPKGAPLILANKAGNESGDKYVWNTGASTPALKITKEGRYSLTVTSTNGCSTTEGIKISKDCYLDVPNAFTPNEDGANDYFFPRQLLSKSLKYFQMQIYNRWGQLIFETTDLNGRGWNGRFNDKAQPSGVYVYKITIETQAGEHSIYEGNVTLLR